LLGKQDMFQLNKKANYAYRQNIKRKIILKMRNIMIKGTFLLKALLEKVINMDGKKKKTLLPFFILGITPV